MLRLLMTWMTKLSPQSATMVGPGIDPFTVIAERVNPSGETSVSTSSSQYSRVTPVSGTSLYQSVSIEKSHQLPRLSAVLPEQGALFSTVLGSLGALIEAAATDVAITRVTAATILKPNMIRGSLPVGKLDEMNVI